MPLLCFNVSMFDGLLCIIIISSFSFYVEIICRRVLQSKTVVQFSCNL